MGWGSDRKLWWRRTRLGRAGELWGSNGRRFSARERRLVAVAAAAGEG